MTEAERRRYYGWHRVLIEYQRLIHPQFDDAVLYFTGAQVELLRNLMQYARQPDGYVSIYGPDSYLIPTAAEWDDIQAIVADMEETLMGNPNVIWGYTAALGATVSWTSDGTTPYTLSSAVVPAGEVWVVNSARASHNNAGALALWLYAVNTGNAPIVDGSQTAGLNVLVGNTQPIILAAGGKVDAVIYSLPTSQVIYLHLQGYKMDVPV